MPQNDPEVEDLLVENIGSGNLGACDFCKGSFTAEDKIVEVVRGKKPRHFACWEKMGKPCRKSWGHRPYRPENAVTIRQAVETSYCHVWRYRNYRPEPFQVPQIVRDCAWYTRHGKYDIRKRVESLETRAVKLGDEYQEVVTLPLFPNLMTDLESRWNALMAEYVECAELSNELYAKTNPQNR